MTADWNFEDHRSYLTQLAYRMLGTVAEAEDLVQDTYLRWRRAGQPVLRNPRAWLTRTCTRLCLDRIRSQALQREEYLGEWLPEPWVGDAEENRSELDETLSMALMATVQKLKPKERAAFLLHDVFDYGFAEVAEILELQPAHCRQLAVRARERLRGQRLGSGTDKPTAERLTRAFFDALASGDLQGLRAVLSADVVLRTDGGGQVSAARQPLHGMERVLRFLDRIFISARHPAPVNPRPVWFSGGPATLLLDQDRVVSAFQLQIHEGHIEGIYVQRNPDKLRAWNRQARGQ